MQDATHAPHPIHVADSNAASASSLGIGVALASFACPVETETYPPEEIILSNEVLSTDKSLIIGKDFALQGSIIIAVSYTHLTLPTICSV